MAQLINNKLGKGIKHVHNKLITANYVSKLLKKMAYTYKRVREANGCLMENRPMYLIFWVRI